MAHKLSRESSAFRVCLVGWRDEAFRVCLVGWRDEAGIENEEVIEK